MKVDLLCNLRGTREDREGKGKGKWKGKRLTTGKTRLVLSWLYERVKLQARTLKRSDEDKIVFVVVVEEEEEEEVVVVAEMIDRKSVV